MTLQQALAEARTRLVSAGIAAAEASVDVELYARTILGWDRARLLVEYPSPAPEALEPTLSAWIARREHREPTAYIVGKREFWGLELVVTPAVLIPRPETELIVEAALDLLPSGNGTSSTGPRVADIGTGSGCVAVALAHERLSCRIVASDVSSAALEVARVNAVRHGVEQCIEFVHTSYLDGVPGTFDLIAANPPYVKEGDRPALSRDVRHEPEVALFGGAEGLRDIGGVLQAAATKLTAGGWLLMEFGYGQEDAVTTMVAAHPELRFHGVRGDLQGIPRTAIIQRHE